MTSDVTDALAGTPDATTRTGLDATLQHVALLRAKRERLLASQVDAEKQLLYRAGQIAAAGGMSELDLADLYMAYSAVAAPGYMDRWNEVIPIPAARMKHFELNAPNCPDGTWAGIWPSEGGPVPLRGISVVYVLYDEMNQPCYTGSSHNLRARLKRHRRDGKHFIRWTAYRCADREAAYQLEEKLLGEHQPYLNKKRFR